MNVNLTHVFVKPLKMCARAIFRAGVLHRECNSVVVPTGEGGTLICI